MLLLITTPLFAVSVQDILLIDRIYYENDKNFSVTENFVTLFARIKPDD